MRTEIQAAIACIASHHRPSPSIGTGALVTPRHVITALHVVADRAAALEALRQNEPGPFEHVVELAFPRRPEGEAAGDVRVFETATGRLVANMRDQCNRVHTIARSPDGARLVSVFQGTAMVHQMRTEALIASVCGRPRRDLSEGEWARFFGGRDRHAGYHPICPRPEAPPSGE